MLALPLAALLLAAQPAAAPRRAVPLVCHELTAVEVRDRVDSYLRAIDVEIDADEWRALGPAAVPLLESVARDPAALPTRRAHALSALALVAGPASAGLLGAVAAGEDEPLGVRLAAVQGLGAATAGSGLTAALRPILESARDPRVRAAAARQLAERGAGAGCALVVARAWAEEEPARAFFGPALHVCRPPPPRESR
jgi:hypothetical protein